MPEVQRQRSGALRLPEEQGRLGVRLPEPRLQTHIRCADSPTEHHREDGLDPAVQLLARIRKAKKISIQDLAEACDMKRQQVSLILNGKTANPGIRTLRRIAEALDLGFALVLKEELTSQD